MKQRFYKIDNLSSSSFSSLFKKPSDLDDLLADKDVTKIIRQAQEEYLPWQKFKNKDLSLQKKKKIWGVVKLQRSLAAKSTIIRDEEGRKFTFNPRSYVQFLHEIDLELGGNFMGKSGFNDGDRHQFIRKNLIEESIASSQLEGANSSRKVAKNMLEEGRKPRDKSEQMIVNNHEAMKLIEEELKNKEMSIEIIKDLHRKITFNTIDDCHQGAIRETLDENGEPLVITPWDDDVITYKAPNKEFVEKELKKFVEFANDRDDEGFIHPLIKAIMLHFWIGLLHPFEDGNGRLARIIFYWYMLRKDYWAFSYLSISERILKSSKQYSMAYIYSEQDDNDLNYFIHYNISKIKLARKNFAEYMIKVSGENRKISEKIKDDCGLNSRQMRLLQSIAKSEQDYTSITMYRNANEDISKLTAISDLRKLVEGGFFTKVKRGRNVYYRPTDKVTGLL